ncbi:hypothetical protein HAX54_035489 [Datura stramonium]|uniref:RING-type E3 ubiquitin transferase n=1 Tax=Datura stramonium TaxID=4076 RepID=A0ABS8VGT3_DATST|nr:hypothetical protein [Datura stramonium]
MMSGVCWVELSVLIVVIDDDDDVDNDLSELIETIGNMLDYIDYMISQLHFDALSDHYDEENEDDDLLDELYDFDALSDHYDEENEDDHLLDEVYDFDALSDLYDEENEDDDEVLKCLKIKTHQAPAKDGVDAEVESEMICAICQSEFEHEENIGMLQCGHEYHTDCINSGC